MIKAKMTLKDGRPLYLFGLSEMNLLKLREGLPMQIKLEPMGGSGEIVIMYGTDEGAIARDLADLIGPETKLVGMKGFES